MTRNDAILTRENFERIDAVANDRLDGSNDTDEVVEVAEEGVGRKREVVDERREERTRGAEVRNWESREPGERHVLDRRVRLRVGEVERDERVELRVVLEVRVVVTEREVQRGCSWLPDLRGQRKTSGPLGLGVLPGREVRMGASPCPLRWGLDGL